jgi:hypothetical protein
MEQKAYSRVLVSRPVIPHGEGHRLSPRGQGGQAQPLDAALFDNLEFIIDVSHSQNLKSVDQLINNKVIEIEALTYIRGRSLPKAVYYHRRGAKPQSSRSEDHRVPGGSGFESHHDRRSFPDRQAPTWTPIPMG